MSEDIVTRLRKKGADERNSYGMLVDRYDDFLDIAADEIERLRAELQSYYDEDEEIRRGRSGD